MVNPIRRRINQLTEPEVNRQVEIWQETGATISDAAAVTIAAWWQSPGSIGHVLASFASGCEIDRADLAEDIARTEREIEQPTAELDALSAWLDVQP